MRLSKTGVPVVILSHRKREFLPRAIASLRTYGHGITDVIVVDDSGDAGHHHWLDDHGYQFSTTSVTGERVGYREASQMAWFVAATQADGANNGAGVDHVLMWEEDFVAVRPFSTRQMGRVLDLNAGLAQLNLQRQSVYGIERRLGYMESHAHRDYELTRTESDGIGWVSRMRPFTTNPGLIKREVLNIEWPARDVCDKVAGGAEPAMSIELETAGYYFGWLGPWNTPHTKHISTDRQSGIGY